MKRNNVIAIIAILVVIVLAAILYAAGHKSTTTSPSPSPSPSARPSGPTSPSTSPAAAASPSASVSAVTMDYTGSGFTPTSITVKSGGQVTFKNSTAQAIQVDSDPHPTHTDNPELNVGTVAPGQSVSVTLTKAGTWGIHNHLDPTVRATIIVQ